VTEHQKDVIARLRREIHGLWRPEDRLLHYGSWGATEQETGVSQRSSSQNSYFLRKKAVHSGMGSYSFAKVPCKSQDLCDNFCKGLAVTY
jgi:hypothetical protein